MKLPKLNYPVYDVKLMSVNKPVKFRPFLVKEQKLLMMAVESQNIETVVDSIKQVINNCVIEENFDVNSLPLIDIEQFFLNLRARSVGEIIDIYFKCRNVVDDAECNMVINIPINLLEEVQLISPIESSKIMFTEKVGVLMKYPSLEQIKILVEEENAANKLIINCMDKIFDEEEVYNVSDASEEELIEFLDGLSSSDYDKLEKFVSNSPKIRYEKKHSCSKCGYEHNILLEGLNDFFI